MMSMAAQQAITSPKDKVDKWHWTQADQTPNPPSYSPPLGSPELDLIKATMPEFKFPAQASEEEKLSLQPAYLSSEEDLSPIEGSEDDNDDTISIGSYDWSEADSASEASFPCACAKATVIVIQAYHPKPTIIEMRSRSRSPPVLHHRRSVDIARISPPARSPRRLSRRLHTRNSFHPSSPEPLPTSSHTTTAPYAEPTPMHGYGHDFLSMDPYAASPVQSTPTTPTRGKRLHKLSKSISKTFSKVGGSTSASAGASPVISAPVLANSGVEMGTAVYATRPALPPRRSTAPRLMTRGGDREQGVEISRPIRVEGEVTWGEERPRPQLRKRQSIIGL